MYDILFDAKFYRQRYAVSEKESLRHFIAEGDRIGFDPSPYFSTRFYKERYPRWQANGASTAAEDFLRQVRRGRLRQPHPLIDPRYYLSTYPDLEGLGAGAALHFIEHGDTEVRSPSAGFDAGFYQRCYLALDQRHPFRHFVTIGQGLGLLPVPHPRSRSLSCDRMAGLTTDLTRPVLLCLHDAQPAGVPILTLDLAEAFAGRGWQPVFALHRAGPLIDRFRQLGPALILAEGWDWEGLVAGLPPRTPVLVNTAAAADMAGAPARAGHPSLVLMHEMAEYIREQGFVPHLRSVQAAGARLIASMPRMAEALVDEVGTLEVLRPGIILPKARLRDFRRMRHWRRRQTGPVFIGAGHADRRKGFDLFLEAAARLSEAHADARFIWLGALDAWARDLADQALAKGLDLTLPGFVADSLAWYRAADVYLLTSRQDPGPTTVIHAAAMGTPFVGYAADIGIIGMTEGVGDFVPPGDVDAYVAAAARAVASSAAHRRALRRHIGAETAFAPYVDALAERLMPRRSAG